MAAPVDDVRMRNKILRYPGSMKALWAALLFLCACTTPNPARACADGSCSSAEFPYCDVEGAITGEPGTCVAVTCTPGAVETCLGDDALTCTATGDGYERVPCDLGCNNEPEPHCRYIEPRYLPDACDSPAADERLFVNGSTSLDPNDDSTCNGGIVEQTGAPGICILRYREITVTSGGQLKLLGKLHSGSAADVGRVVALVADDKLTVEGVLDISADGLVNGPGGGLVISGGRVEFISSRLHKAGGGAGGLTNGAAGGSTANSGEGGVGGLAATDPALLAALFGGAAAGRNMCAATIGGGGGGGAATLISCRGDIAISGTVDAGGGGGIGGRELLGSDAPAWGGGAGGYVVLQARAIEVTGGIFANGGGGGTGMAPNLLPGADGADGLRSTAGRAPGHSGVNGGGDGGLGGVGVSNLPTVGGKPTVADASPGGGGGSVGFLQTYTPAGVSPATSTAMTSPAFRPNITLKTR